MDTLLQDMRYGGRMLLKNKGFTLVAIAAITYLGILVRLISVAFVACSLPARRTGRLNPTVALAQR